MRSRTKFALLALLSWLPLAAQVYNVPFMPRVAGGPDIIQVQGWEAGLNGWIDGGSNAARTSGGGSQIDDAGVAGGSWSMALADNTSSSYTQETFNLDGYSTVYLQYWIKGSGVDAADCFDLIVDGVTKETHGRGGSSCGTESFGNGSFSELNTSFTCGVDITCDSSVTIRIENEMNSPTDIIYIDGPIVTAE